jgi:hypothetical protein
LIEIGLLVLEKKIFKIFKECLLFRYYLALGKGVIVFHLYNSESPLPKDALCQVWLKLAWWFWRRRFLNDPTLFWDFCDYLPFKTDLTLDLYNFEFPLPKDDLCQV